MKMRKYLTVKNVDHDDDVNFKLVKHKMRLPLPSAELKKYYHLLF